MWLRDNFEPDTTFPALVKAIWVIFENSWKIQWSLKKALAWSWRQLSATVVYFSDLCGWRNVLCDFLPTTIDKTEFDSDQTHVLNKVPKNARKTISVNLQYFRCTGGKPKKPSFSNGRDPVDLLGCKRGKSHGSKKLPAGVINFGLLRNFEIWSWTVQGSSFKCLRRALDYIFPNENL